MKHVAIVGTGLIGASFGLALKEAGFDGRITGVSSQAALDDALACGAIDDAATLEEAVAEADLVFLAQTIRRIIATLPAVGRFVRPGALVTDAGSTKAAIVEAGCAISGRAQFLGGHPMAGKERRGAAAADADLFQGRPWVLTPRAPAELETPAAREFLSWLEQIGAKPLAMSPPQEHDRVVALTSHLPQLLSTALAAALDQELSSVERLPAGPGLSDMVRLAGSSYELWGDILATNTAAIGAALDSCIARLQSVRAGLTSDATRRAFEAGAAFSRRLRG